MSDILDKLNSLRENLELLDKKIDSTNLENQLLKNMEKNKVDINILGQDISVMCTDEEKSILLKSRDRILNEAEKVKSQTKNIGHDYFLVLVLLNIAGSDIKNAMKIDELKSIESEIDNINNNITNILK